VEPFERVVVGAKFFLVPLDLVSVPSSSLHE
jgi:hypothetical protein